MIEIRELSCTKGSKEILRSVDLTITVGSFWLVAGPNGAGKTTLLRILGGFEKNHSGQVKLLGRDLKTFSRRELSRQVAYLPQYEHFSLPISVAEVIGAGRYPYSTPFKKSSNRDRDIIADTAERFGLLPFLDRDIRTLSGGERKKVLLASAYAQDVPLILLDEPFVYLDPQSAVQLSKYLLELKQEGKTVVAVSHQISMLFPLASHLAAMKSGHILYSGIKKFDSPLLQKTFNVNFRHIFADNREIIYAEDL